MATREELEQRIIEAIDLHRELILEVAETIRQNPEIAFQEYQASALLAASIQKFGYEVEKPIGGLETAFRASRHGRSDGPIIAVLAEYNALPGIGHGCGHNLIAASGLAAAIGLSAVMGEIPGIFEVIGCPAEEAGGGKIVLQQAGVFDDVDAALMVHHAGHQTGVGTRYPEGTCLAVTELTFEYFGKPAHAAADPQNGINALNAVIALFTGIDALRQHVPMETRIHGIITHGGDAPNIVPHYAAARFYVRAATLEDLERGAARALGQQRLKQALQGLAHEPGLAVDQKDIGGRGFRAPAPGVLQPPRKLPEGDLGHAAPPLSPRRRGDRRPAAGGGAHGGRRARPPR